MDGCHGVLEKQNEKWSCSFTWKRFCDAKEHYFLPDGVLQETLVNSPHPPSPFLSQKKLHFLPNYFRCPINSHSAFRGSKSRVTLCYMQKDLGILQEGKGKRQECREERKRRVRRTRDWRTLFHGRLHFYKVQLFLHKQSPVYSSGLTTQ